LDNVRAEFSFTSLTYNIGRALNLVGVEVLMAAVRVRKDGFGNKIDRTLPPIIQTTLYSATQTNQIKVPSHMPIFVKY
jgi:hypothetical protein